MIHSMIIKNMIKPGHTVVVIGKYGSGRYNYTVDAIQENNLIPYTCEVPLYFSYEEYENKVWDLRTFKKVDLKSFAKSIPGNGVIIMNNIERIMPALIAPVLEQMLNPDRAMVLIGEQFYCSSILDRSTVVKL